MVSLVTDGSMEMGNTRAGSASHAGSTTTRAAAWDFAVPTSAMLTGARALEASVAMPRPSGP